MKFKILTKSWKGTSFIKYELETRTLLSQMNVSFYTGFEVVAYLLWIQCVMNL